MQITHDFDHAESLPVGWGVRVMFLGKDTNNPLVRRLQGLGGSVEVEAEFYSALSAIIDDPMGYGLFVMDCDGLGGEEAGQRAQAMLAAVNSRVPLILISREHSDQVFPQEREVAVQLRAPLSAISLRVGFEHALRDRLLWRAA